MDLRRTRDGLWTELRRSSRRAREEMVLKMEFFSILDLREHPVETGETPGFYQDLNLDQIIERIQEGWGSPVSGHYYRIPENREEEAYRRSIYQDVKKQEVYDALDSFCRKMKAREESGSRKEEVSEPLQKQVWHLREVHLYCSALQEVEEALEHAKVQSEGLLRFRKLTEEYLAAAEFQEMSAEAAELFGQLGGFRLLLTYEKNRFAVEEGVGSAEYESFLSECFPGQEVSVKSPFLASPELAELELEVVKIFKKKHGEFFKAAAKFYDRYIEYAEENFVRMQSEAEYYLAYCAFQQKMEEKGFAFAAPETGSGREMNADGLYDLALACVCVEENREVVSNDMSYRKGESFFVLTGPNQGGKTTFARSLGQLVFLAKMGLDVPARAACVPYFSRILTHFSVEESVETGRGKLMEELDRLLPMMEESDDNAFVIINELFTTAANYDAGIMGKKVLEHFIKKECMGIYVTHLLELINAHERTVSLRAVLNEQKIQTFKIQRSTECDEAGAGNQVKKYRLTYEQIKERLAPEKAAAEGQRETTEALVAEGQGK